MDQSMSLKEKLEAIHAGSLKRIPEDKQAIMSRATNDLRNSGIMESMAKVGDKAPDFSGTNHDGQAIAYGDVLGRGPVVLSFFRGHW